MANYSDHYYLSGDGLRLYARDYPCRDEANANPQTVLCMHGLTRNSADFAHLADHLSERYRVVAVDNRGRGLSEYDAHVANYTPATYVQDMFTLLADLNIDQVILCGTSMGGLMSFIMAAMQPARVRGMIINDIGPEVDQTGLDRIKNYVGKSRPVSSWPEAIVQAKEINAIAFPDFSDAEWEDFTRGIYRDEGGVPVLAYDPAISQPMEDEESAAVPPDLWPVFEACSSIPMLVIRGENSDILALDCVKTMSEKHSGLRYFEVPGRGHAPTLNEAAARVAIDDFLKSLC
ncbi:alpha/beta fold hydrolase [Pseudohalioglobus lutimaris]|uniref:Alpha/beta hydrolase n=1 Tax=Pseudohalioglobus lutimaris TaxID=1737061 RepID=A0A2N5X3T1_9GAMM|nr:alpha/beta hydrolase [Pseudohalioglobus lutimaris]PLW69156.1 alpha/beta hydrolase [Pseudohalioglobus lutimaris]